jgi:hypothetical protein
MEGKWQSKSSPKKKRCQSISKFLLMKFAVRVRGLCKEGGSGKSSPIKKKMAVHVKIICKEGGSG